MSTSCRTCTGPKLLLSLEISRIGSVTRGLLGRSALDWLLVLRRWPGGSAPAPPSWIRDVGPGKVPPSLDAELRAVVLDALADVGRRKRARVDDVLDVRLGDDLRRQQQRLDLVVRSVRVLERRQRDAGVGRVGARDQGDRELGGSAGL